ncbi:MAG: 50S ribosomal protein L35 [Candidatus Yanofskybacteria bacterium]|nr:50S ribosomal protein L35 [Candidatus Yanofskybacteria bacterium]
MHTGKTNRSFLKRVKITGKGKIMKRPPHQDHFNAKEAGNAARKKKGHKMAPSSLMRSAKALLQSNI